MRFWLLLMLLSSSVLAQQPDKDVIEWAIPDAPPFHIASGERAGQGFCDHLTSAIVDALPEITHRITVMPHPRIALLRQQKAPLCFPCMIKTQDTDSTLYSDATHFYPPHRVLTRAETATKLKQLYGHPLSLRRLLANHQFRLGLTMGRKFGDQLQPLLDGDDHSPFSQQIISASLGAAGVLELIEKGRLDYTIDYAVVGRYYEQTSGHRLHSMTIAENQDDFVLGAVGCSNSEWGRHAIANINRTIPKLHRSAAFLEAMETWLAEDDLPYWPTFQRLVTPLADAGKSRP